MVSSSSVLSSPLSPTEQEVCDFPVEKMVYVMTDFTESNFKFWAEHPVSFGDAHI